MWLTRVDGCDVSITRVAHANDPLAYLTGSFSPALSAQFVSSPGVLGQMIRHALGITPSAAVTRASTYATRIRPTIALYGLSSLPLALRPWSLDDIDACMVVIAPGGTRGYVCEA